MTDCFLNSQKDPLSISSTEDYFLDSQRNPLSIISKGAINMQEGVSNITTVSTRQESFINPLPNSWVFSVRAWK